MAWAKLLVDVKADIANFSQNMSKASNDLAKFSKSMGSIKGAALVYLGRQAYSLASQLYGVGKSTASALNEIERLAAVAGLSTEAFQKLQYAAKMSDVENADLSVGLKRLSVSLNEASVGTGDAAGRFKSMGFSVLDSSGKIKSLDVVMSEIADKFQAWEDGPRKIAIAIELFGRSGEALIPMLNRGSGGLREFYKEAQKLGVILDESMIKKGSELDNSFKRLESWASSTFKKMAVSVYEAVAAYDELIKKINIVGLAGKYRDYITGKPKESPMVEEAGKRYAELENYYKRIQPPALPGKEKKSESNIVKEVQAALESLMAAEEERGIVALARHELIESAWAREAAAAQKLYDIEMDRAAMMAEDMFPSMDSVKRIQEEMTMGADALHRSLTEMQGLVSEFGWEDYASGVDAASESMRRLNQLTIQNTESARVLMEKSREIDGSFQSFGETLSSSWSSHWSAMIKGTESGSEALKGIFADMADHFVSLVTKMVAEWLFFETLTGEGGGKSFLGKGSGLGGLFHSVVGLFREGGIIPGGFTPAHAFQHGGLITKPTLGVIGEAGPEAVVPLKSGRIPIEGGKGNQTFINMNIEATDVDSFERKYGPVVNKINYVSARRGGIARRNMRNYF